MVLNNKKDYECPWCNNQFSCYVYYNPNYDKQTGKQIKKGIVSTQVRCNKCGSLIPTWKKELTNNSVGRKHIHKR